MQWRYQSVIHDTDHSVSLVEVFYEDDNPIGFANLNRGPVGNDQADLIGELEAMLRDARDYPPITRNQLLDTYARRPRAETGTKTEAAS